MVRVRDVLSPRAVARSGLGWWLGFETPVDGTCNARIPHSGSVQGGVGIQKRHLGSNFFSQQQEVDLPTT